jgi:hypothetical protein
VLLALLHLLHPRGRKSNKPLCVKTFVHCALPAVLGWCAFRLKEIEEYKKVRPLLFIQQY